MFTEPPRLKNCGRYGERRESSTLAIDQAPEGRKMANSLRGWEIYTEAANNSRQLLTIEFSWMRNHISSTNSETEPSRKTGWGLRRAEKFSIAAAAYRGCRRSPQIRTHQDSLGKYFITKRSADIFTSWKDDSQFENPSTQALTILNIRTSRQNVWGTTSESGVAYI